MKSLEDRAEGFGDTASQEGSPGELPKKPVEDGDEEMQPESAEIRDEEAETDIATSVTGDPFEEYDIDVWREGEALHEYLALVGK